MDIIINFLKYLYRNRRGASITEYGVIIAGVALALILVYSVVTGTLHDGFIYIKDTILGALGAG